MKILIIGGTFSGVSAACALARQGHQVALTDAHAYLGGDPVACQHTWAQNGRCGCRLDQPNGRTKMELYGEACDAGVRLLLLAKLCGILIRGDQPCGAVLATKYGVQAITADCVIDATESGVAAWHASGARPAAAHAEYGFDMSSVTARTQDMLPVPSSLGVDGDAVRVGDTMRSQTVNVSFTFPVPPLEDALARSDAERKAHEIMAAAAMEIRKLPGYTDAAVDLSGSHLRLLYDRPARCACMPFTEARLPLTFTMEDKRRLQRDAAKKALAVAAAYTPAPEDQAMRWLCGGKRIDGFSLGAPDTLGLCRVTFDPEKQGFAERRADAVIAGAGTGGAMSGWAMCEHGTDVLLADSLYFCGGTNTVGRVYSAWHGYTGGKFGERYRAVSAMADAAALSPRMGAMMFWERCFGRRFIGGVTVCGVVRAGARVTGILTCGEYGFELLRGRFVTDGTADGDLCAFTGLPWTVGGDRDGMVQTSSMWGFENNTAKIPFGYARFNSDEDVIDPDSYADLLRGIGLGYLHNSEYEITEMCMQRESRRFACRARLTMAGIARRETHPDDIAVAQCTHDTHGRSSSLMNQFSLFAPAMAEKRLPDDPANGDGKPAPVTDIRIRMPFGMFLPLGLDNVAIVGKSMSGEREAVSLCRMNPDLSNAAYAVGTAVAEAVRQGVEKLADTDTAPAQAWLRACGVLPLWSDKPGDTLGIAQALDNLSDPQDGGFSAMVQPGEAIVPLLRDALKEGGVRADNAARALAWHGCPNGAERLVRLLKAELPLDPVRLETRPGNDIYAVRADGFEKLVNPHPNYGQVVIDAADPDLSYARVNRLIVLLGLAGGAGLDEVIRLGETACIGGVMPGRLPYAVSRIDIHRVIGEDRVWAVLFACERWGSRFGAETLVSYLDDGRAVFAKMARMALREVYGRDEESAQAWRAALDQMQPLPVSSWRGDPFCG